MAATQANNLLRQKASTARKERDQREMTPSRALRLSLARTAGSLWELPVDVRAIDQSEIGLEDLGSFLSDDMLLLLMDGPNGARGAVAIDRAIAAAMVEVQTIGTISPKGPGDRVPTPTDAAMIAPWLDGALESADVTLCGGDESGHSAADSAHGWMIGYRFGAMAENTRALGLALDAPDLHCLDIELDVGVGLRSGRLKLVLPTVAPEEKSADHSGDADPEHVQEQLKSIPAELQVIAGRISLTLAQATALKPGDCLPVDELLIANAELRSPDGTCHGTARMGKLDGRWAVRLGGADISQGDVPPLMDTHALMQTDMPALTDDGAMPSDMAEPLPELTDLAMDASDLAALGGGPDGLPDLDPVPMVPMELGAGGLDTGGEAGAADPMGTGDLPLPQSSENLNFE